MNRSGSLATVTAATAAAATRCAGLAGGVVVCAPLVSEEASGFGDGGRSLTNVNLDVTCALHGCGLCGSGRCKLDLALFCEEGASLRGLLFLLRRAGPHTRLLR